MHELALCQSLIAQVQKVAHARRAERVLSVTVRIGTLSGVVPELLNQAWPLASAGTVGEGADLVLEELDVRVRCSRCGADTPAAPNRLVCGECGDWRTELLSGDELILARVELETRNEAVSALGTANV